LRVQPLASRAATYQRSYRARLARGQIVLRVAVPEVALVEKLIEVDLLSPEHSDDRNAITAALEHVIKLWCVNTNATPDRDLL
jgi:hypothetical protein